MLACKSQCVCVEYSTVELSLRKTVHWSSRSEKLHIPLPCSHIAAPRPLVCQHYVSAWAEGNGFSIGGRAFTTIPATSVLLYPGTLGILSIPWITEARTRSHIQKILQTSAVALGAGLHRVRNPASFQEQLWQRSQRAPHS